MLLIGTATATAEDPKEIIKKSIQAQGGESLLRQVKAIQIEAKGSIPHPEHPDGLMPFHASVHLQYPDLLRLTLDAKLLENESKFSTHQTYNRGKAWIETSLEPRSETAANAQYLKDWMYVDGIRLLTPLLNEKEYSLKFVGETKLKNRSVLEVKASAKGRPDVQLFFDKTSALLTAVKYRSVDSEGGNPAGFERDFDDYREPAASNADESFLKKAQIPIDGPALLEYLRKHTPSKAQQETVRGIIRKLGDPSFEVREKAKDELVATGASAIPLLRQALTDPDTEIAGRVKECLEKLDNEKDIATLAAVIRRLGAMQPKGTVEALLAFASSAPNDSTMQEVAGALATAGVKDGKPVTELEQALSDKDPARRAVAAAALGREVKDTKKLSGLRLRLTGLKWPMKETLLQDGKSFMNWEATDLQFYSSLDETLFKP